MVFSSKGSDLRDGLVMFLKELVDESKSNLPMVVSILSRTVYVYNKFVSDQKYRWVGDYVEKKIVERSKLREWKTLTSGQLVMYKVTEKNKWEILEYFAKNNPKIFNQIIHNYFRTTKAEKKTVFTRDEIIDRYKDNKNIPEALTKFVNKQVQLKEMGIGEIEKPGRKVLKEQPKKEYSWVENGDIVQFSPISANSI